MKRRTAQRCGVTGIASLVFACLACLATGLVVAPVRAQSAAASADVAADPLAKLPPPLESVAGNVRDLEVGGLFMIASVRVGGKGYGDDEAICWTLRANKAVSCRHVEILLEQLRDVRFYYRPTRQLNDEQASAATTESSPAAEVRQRKPLNVEVHSALLYYDQRITDGASNGLVLPRASLFDVWIYLNSKTAQKLLARKVNVVVFGPFQR